MNSIKYKVTHWPAFPAVVMCVVFFLINCFCTKGFLKPHVILGLLSANMALMCTAMGCACVILCGGMDISLGSIISLVNVLFVILNEAGLPLGTQILICLIAALVMGLINGFLIGILRVTPLLATYATSTIYGGIALWLFPTPRGVVMKSFCKFYNSWLAFIPVPLLFAAVVFIIWCILMMTPLKYYIYTTGRDPEKAYISSVPVGKTQLFVYAFAGLIAGVGGLAISGSTQGGDALVGVSLSMNAIAACVIGGVSLSGGKGSMIGSVFGAIFLFLVMNVVAALKIPSLYQSLVKGLILLVGVIASIVVETRLQIEKIETAEEERKEEMN